MAASPIEDDTMPVAGIELKVERVFQAPCDIVWQAWTEPERLILWWGPADHIMTVNRFDLFPGGMFHYGLRSLRGLETWGRLVFIDVTPPEKLAFVNSYSNVSADITRHTSIADYPMEILNICTFKEISQETIFSMKCRPQNATDREKKVFIQNHLNLKNALAATFDQLAQYLASMRF